ncbi:MAG: transporter substrate-binding protein [Paenibacillaceae bacterium]|jgi:putative aldouronate transport system substrate-binding protein|nr:transporter substrate-binding protein [Paenibacillaceae bacterium]
MIISKKIGLYGLGLVMAAALPLAGCSDGTEQEAAPVPSSGSAAPQASGAAAANELKPVKLIWYQRNAEPKNVQSVMKKANEIIQQKINATLEFRFINPGDYDSKMQLIMSSAEEYDIAFTSSWANNYLNNVSKGAYLPLDEIIGKYPKLQALFTKEIWDAVRVNGKIYGVPNNQIMADQQGLWFKKDLADKYKLDVANIKSWEDMTPILQKIKDNEPGVNPIRSGPKSLFEEYQPAVEDFHVDTKTWKVHYQPEEQLDRYKLMRDWNQKGFFPQDVATLKDEASLIKAGKIFSRFSRYKPGGEAEFKQLNGFEPIMISTGPAVIQRGGVLSTLNAVSATSKNPERAVMLINLINTDKELFNLLKFGIEGQDYVKTGENRIEKKPDTYLLAGWMFGNEFLSYLVPGQPDDVWEQTRKMNETAAVDPMISFSFDRKAVENEIAQLSAVTKEYEPILLNGLDDPEKMLKAFMEKRKAAGHDKVLAEIQRQVDEWRKTQK